MSGNMLQNRVGKQICQRVEDKISEMEDNRDHIEQHRQLDQFDGQNTLLCQVQENVSAEKLNTINTILKKNKVHSLFCGELHHLNNADTKGW